MTPRLDDGLEPGAPPPPPLRRAAAAEVHRRLETLEDASAFSAAARARVGRLAQRLLEMQEMAEKIADVPGSVEDREVACAQIGLLAQQCDVIARQAVFQAVPALEGGVFRFELVGEAEALEIELPCLRSRGEGSLGLFEHVDAMLVVVGAGGAVLAGQEVPLPEPELGLPEPVAIPSGTYRTAITYQAPDASLVRLELLPHEGDEPLAVREGLDLSAEGEGVEVDLHNGLALTLDRVARAAELEVGFTTVQTIELRHEVGERLESVEGWFHETVQPRDFELYALFLEGPRQRVAEVDARITRFDEELAEKLDAISERLSGGSLEPSELVRALGPGAEAWSVLSEEALQDALAEEV